MVGNVYHQQLSKMQSPASRTNTGEYSQRAANIYNNHNVVSAAALTTSTRARKNPNTIKNVPRKPTRRPDPRINNRNALMARENRKKKKEHVDGLEREHDELRNENAALRERLSKRSSTVQVLRDERAYLKSIIANKTSILLMMQTIQETPSSNDSPASQVAQQLQQQPDISQSVNNNHNNINVANNNDSSIISNNINITNMGSVTSGSIDSINNRSTLNNQLDNDSDCFRLSSSSYTPIECMSPISELCMPELPWESIIHLSDDVSMEVGDKFTDEEEEEEGDYHVNDDDHNDAAPEPSLLQSKVSHEHNYSLNHINEQSRKPRRAVTETTTTYSIAEHLHRGGKVRPSWCAPSTGHGPGICLHLSGGRVSLEFCASCHRHAQNAWDEE